MKITVVGAGYVGFPLGLLLAQKHEVVFLDSSVDKVQMLNQKISPFTEKEAQNFIKKVDFLATTNLQEAYTGADFVIISVPTDYEEGIGLNTHIVESVIQDAVAFNPKATIVIRSTVPVGFTLRMREKFNINNLIFSPEFSREGLAHHDCLYPSRIIVGDGSEQSSIFAELLKDIAVKKDVPVILMANSDAEAVKLFSNTYLAMRVAFFNELDSYSILNGLNTLNVISGVELDSRIGLTYNNPSFGFGGYCLPKDSKQVSISYGLLPNYLIKSINKSNQSRIDFIVNDILRKNPKTIGIYRLQMKKDSNSIRKSSVVAVLNGLLASEASVLIYAPELTEEKFLNTPVLTNLSEFKQRSDLIVANRLDDELSDVRHKVYSRDIKRE